MGIHIIDAVDPAVREAVFRFRYDIYVREMRRRQKDADHDRGRVEDALDRTGILLAARDTASGRIVGTVRANIVAGSDLGIYARLYGLEGLTASERKATSITTRFMVERTKRGTLLAIRLAAALFERGLDRGVTDDYIDCNDHLVGFFHGLGYRRLRMIDHPEYGRVTLMRLDVENVSYLTRIGSPFAAAHERRERVA